MSVRFLQRSDTAANWVSANPVLGDGEIGYVSDEHYHKVGDGVAPWNNLPEQFPDHIREGDSRLSDARTPTAHNHTLADVTDAGTAASSDVTTSATDTTSGSLLKVGDYGAGRPIELPSGSSIDSISIGNFYLGYGGNNAKASSGDNPFTDHGGAFSLIHTGVGLGSDNDSAYQVQIATRLGNTTDIVVKKTRQKSTLSGSWSDWVKDYHTHNILGTVSQSGGIPTGAIIERGSNANGDYVKFADGTLICTKHRVLTVADGVANASGSLYRSNSLLDADRDYAAPFSGELPTVHYDITCTNATTFAGSAGAPTLVRMAVNVYALSPIALSGSRVLHVSVTAVGRWY